MGDKSGKLASLKVSIIQTFPFLNLSISIYMYNRTVNDKDMCFNIERVKPSAKKEFMIAIMRYLVKTRSQEPGDLLDQGVGGEEGIIGGGELLHLLLVLVELLEVVSAHGVHAQGLGLVNVGLISQ